MSVLSLYHPLHDLRCQWLWRWHCVVLDFACFCSLCWAQASWLPGWDMARPANSEMNNIEEHDAPVYLATGSRENDDWKIGNYITLFCIQECRDCRDCRFWWRVNTPSNQWDASWPSCHCHVCVVMRLVPARYANCWYAWALAKQTKIHQEIIMKKKT